jgi:glucose-1-phosphate cytidylyltransferase
MKVVILAGGLGTRLTEETEVKPKPMVEIGGRPILWHIMKTYAHFGFNEFVVALGYKGEVIKRYFLDYQQLNGNLAIDLSSNEIQWHSRNCENWKIHLIETGQDTMTGGRVKRLEPLLRNETFMLTYGDGLSNVDPNALLSFHRSQGCTVTLTAVRPPSRFGGLSFEGNLLTGFTEKPQIGEGWINGGFMVCEPGLFDYLDGDHSSLEADALERLAADKRLAAHRHEDFWQCMDTLRDVRLMQGLWHGGSPPWKVWE